MTTGKSLLREGDKQRVGVAARNANDDQLRLQRVAAVADRVLPR